ncbi:hypothetical protein FRC09_002626, partial [Ceratobasidium sp. 395]
ASILAMFKISCVDELERDEIETIKGKANQVVYHPKPFKMKLVPRSDTLSALVQSEMSE